MARETGSITNGSYSAVHFADTTYGLAVAAAGITAVSDDGGLTWQAGGLIAAGAAGNLCCHRIDKNKMWVGDDAGKLWYSNDGGTTWTQRIGWVGTGVGDVRAMDWVDAYIGMIVHNDAGTDGTVLMTIDGGYTWQPITVPANDGLNACTLVSPYLAYVVGELIAATGIAAVIKLTRAHAVGS